MRVGRSQHPLAPSRRWRPAPGRPARALPRWLVSAAAAQTPGAPRATSRRCRRTRGSCTPGVSVRLRCGTPVGCRCRPRRSGGIDDGQGGEAVGGHGRLPAAADQYPSLGGRGCAHSSGWVSAGMQPRLGGRGMEMGIARIHERNSEVLRTRIWSLGCGPSRASSFAFNQNALANQMPIFQSRQFPGSPSCRSCLSAQSGGC